MSFKMEDVRCDVTGLKKGEGKGGANTSKSAGIYVVYCGKNVITSRISSSDKYQQVILVVRWGECSPIVEDIMKVLAPSGLSR